MSQKHYLDYEGLQRLVQNINKKYAPIAAILYKGTVADIAHLPNLTDQKPGWMYNVTKGGITTNDFVEGAGHLLADGENVAMVEVLDGTYTAVSPVAGDDPKAKGWYEVDGGTYKLSQDRAVVAGKTYYEADSTSKWDILGGLFDIQDRYLEFGQEFPNAPEDGRVFVYMGDTTHQFNEVTPTGTENPADKGWYEFTAATPVGTENPSEEGWYELADGKYVLSADTEVDNNKTYYVGAVSEDRTVDHLKTYYSYDVQYKQGVIYEFSETEDEWIAKSGSAGDEMIPITAQEIDNLFL